MISLFRNGRGPHVADAKENLTAIQRKILHFFQEQPQAVETARGVATWIGVEMEMITEAVQDLLKRRWLTADETSAVTGYALTRDERLLEQIQEALKAS